MNDALMKEYEKTFMEKVAVIHAGYDETPHTVAMVEVDKSLPDEEKCEIAFMKTNTIDCGWWENEEVTPMFSEKTCRSTSSGDMVLIGNAKYKCVAVGWEKM
jgi:hypothetical protein